MVLLLPRSRTVFLIVLVLFCVPSAVSQSASNREIGQRAHLEHYGEIPLTFEENAGQMNSDITFLARGAGYAVFLRDREAVIALSKKTPIWSNEPGELLRKPGRVNLRAGSLRMQLVGARPVARMTGEGLTGGTVNYFLGNDPSKWRSGIRTFETVKYSDVYPGVDLVCHGSQRLFEFDFLVSPGASVSPIRIGFGGAAKLHVDDRGNLIVSLAGGEVVFHVPRVYQEFLGVRTIVRAGFGRIKGNSVGFVIGSYDPSKRLIIDPVLTYSTYLGGTYFDAITALAVDPAGNAYVTGNADSCDFPTTSGAFDPTVCTVGGTGRNVVFVAKINPAGNSLLYSTFLGYGSASAVAIDNFGEACVTGTAWAGFPVTQGAYQTVDNAAASGAMNPFVTKLNPTGTGLVYSTYLGGSSGQDYTNAIAVDSSANAYIAGSATSTDFPATPGAFETVNTTPGQPFSFVSKLNATGTALGYSTYLLGKGQVSPFAIPTSVANGIAVDSSGNAYLVGTTSDQSFPVTPGAFQPSFSTDPTNLAIFRQTGYVTKFNPTGSQLIYSSYLGGSYISQNQAVAVDSAGNAYVTGGTTGNFNVTPGAFQTQRTGLNAFVSKINPQGTALLYSSYLGGSCQVSGQLTGDTGFAIAIDKSGDAYVAGQTCSLDFPITTGAIVTAKKASFFDAFLAEIDPTGSALLYSTYLGGSGDMNNIGDWANGAGLDGNANIYVAGLTHSSDYPTTAGAFQTATKAGGAGFVSRISVPAGATQVVRDFSISASPATLSVTRGQSGMTSLTLAPQNGFYQGISLSCSGLPSGATCNFSPSSLVLGTSTATGTLTIQTTAIAARAGPQSVPLVSFASTLLVICCLTSKRKRSVGPLMLLATIVGVAGFVNGCGGGSPTGNGGGTTSSSYTVTVSATATSVQHTATLLLTLN